jgi:hypothetical protein
MSAFASGTRRVHSRIRCCDAESLGCADLGMPLNPREISGGGNSSDRRAVVVDVHRAGAGVRAGLREWRTRMAGRDVFGTLRAGRCRCDDDDHDE